MTPLEIAILCVSGLILTAVLVIFTQSLWFRAMVSGAHVGFFKIWGLRVRGLDARAIVFSYIRARKFGLLVSVEQLETIALADRDVTKVIHDVITPRVIETPAVTTICKNGTELSASAKITVRTNLQRVVGGAGEETIIARVCEGIVACIGGAQNHYEFLEKPNIISGQLLKRNFGAGTAFDILSIDIPKVTVGRSIVAEFDVVAKPAVAPVVSCANDILEVRSTPETVGVSSGDVITDLWDESIGELDEREDQDLLFPCKKTRLA